VRLGLAAVWIGLAVGGAVALGLQGRTMPYAGQFITVTGVGPDDVLGARPVLMTPDLRVALSAACVLASCTFALALARARGRADTGRRVGWSVLLGLAAGQALGTLPPSVHFAEWDGTLDRYLLPLLPLSILLLLGALRGISAMIVVTACAVLAMGVCSVAATHDYLAFLDTVWSVAHEANALGVPNTQLDAGAGWDGFQLHERPPSPDVPPHTPHPPWWIDLFAPRTDSSYIVSGAILTADTVILERSYWSWLWRRELPVYLLREPGVAGPP
jgi:hypothetical protein